MGVEGPPTRQGAQADSSEREEDHKRQARKDAVDGARSRGANVAVASLTTVAGTAVVIAEVRVIPGAAEIREAVGLCVDWSSERSH